MTTDPTRTHSCLDGDLRLVSCATPAHPVHVLEYRNKAWHQLPLTHPVSMVATGAVVAARAGEPDDEAEQEEPGKGSGLVTPEGNGGLVLP